MRTVDACRSFYNKSPQYELFQKKEGWQTPNALVVVMFPLLRGGELMLDVGCGPGIVGEEFKKIGWSGSLFGVDIAEKRLKEAKGKSIYRSCIHADAYHLPFANHKFDIVFSNAMVGLTGIRSIEEMRRVVKVGGYLVCVAGEIKSERWCRERFRKVSAFLRKMPNADLILEKDLGSGYTNTDYEDEHYILFLHKIF